MHYSSDVHLTETELTSAALTGAVVHGPDDTNIGSVGGLQGFGDDARIVVEVGGFFGIGAKPVALRVREFAITRDRRGRVHVHTAWSKRALKRLPEYRVTYRAVGRSAV